MEIKINIQKKHFFLLLGMIVLVGIVIAQTTPNPGHAVTEVPGAARNCISNPSAACNSALSASGWNSWEVTSQAALAYTSLNADNSARLGGNPANQYCQQGGSNCPAELNSNTVYKLPANNYCGGSAIICKTSYNPYSAPYDAFLPPLWQNNQWHYQYYDSGLPGLVTSTCQWVICENLN